MKKTHRVDSSLPENFVTNKWYANDTGQIQGPIYVQTMCLFAVSVAFIVSVNILGWAPYVRVYNIAPYVTICVILIEVGRLLRSSISVLLRLYTTVIPAALVIVIAREAHILVSVLFFCFTLCVYLQSGVERLQHHIMIYVVMYLATYSCSVTFMLTFYIDQTGKSMRYARALDPAISSTMEVTYLLTLGLLGIGFLLMEKFIKVYASTLVTWSQQISTMEEENQRLQEQLRELQQQESQPAVTIEAPLIKVLSELKEMAEDSEFDDTTRQKISGAMVVLTKTNKLYNPDINFKDNNKVASDIGGFIDNLLTTIVVPKKTSKSSEHLGVILQPPHASTMKLIFKDEDTELVQYLMESVDNWDFNVFKLRKRSQGRPLYYIAYTLFQRYQLCQKFDIDEEQLKRFLWLIEDGYNKQNPYHNSTHVADVTQCVNFFLQVGGLSELSHPGLNNVFQVLTKSPLAMTYNDRSVLENMHLSTVFRILMDPENNILKSLSEAQFKQLRSSIIEMVLATDLTMHTEYITRFKSKQTTGFDSKNKDDQRLLMAVAIKCADICNPCRRRKTCTKWAQLVTEEFFAQGDLERQKSIPQSPFMDRSKPQIAKCQIGFIEFIVTPLFEAWADLFKPKLEPCLAYLKFNMGEWKRLQAYIQHLYCN